MNKASLDKPEVRAFVEFYMINARSLVSEVGYISLKDEAYTTGLAMVQASDSQSSSQQ